MKKKTSAKPKSAKTKTAKTSSHDLLTVAPKDFSRALKSDQVYLACQQNDFKMPTKMSLQRHHDIISQDRAVQAINMGLGIRKPGYNIFVAGSAGTGKTSVIRSFLERWSKGGDAPSDWVYVYNFHQTESPLALELKAGDGRVLRKMMENVVRALRDDITKALHSEDYENPANYLLNAANDKKARLYHELEKTAHHMGFALKSSRMGIETIPVLQGRQITEKEYARLSLTQRSRIEKRRTQLEPSILEFARKIRHIEQEGNENIESLRRRIGSEIISDRLSPIKERFKPNSGVLKYLLSVKEHMVENLLNFIDWDEEDEPTSEEPQAQVRATEYKERFTEYAINVFVDNTAQKNSPVIIETNPTYYNLFGKIEKNVEFGMYRTDFTMLKPGAVHRANGGYLVLNAPDIFRSGSDSIWEFLKRILKNRLGFIEDIGEQFSMLPTSGLRPEPIPLDIKVIIIGSEDVYQILYDGDEDFRKIFKIKGDFNYRMPRSTTNLNDYAYFIVSRARKESLLPINKSGVSEVIEFGSRLVEDQRYLSTQFGSLKDLIVEADYIARQEKSTSISSKHVEKAIDQKVFRADLYEELLNDSVKHGDYLLTVDGSRIGQVNGLTVISYGDHSFGRVGRITCTVAMNSRGVVNVERAVKLSGRIHDKGVLILTGYLNGLLAKKHALNFSASLCFEQSYGMIDGDSATSPELAVILSALGDFPIKQNIAITGSLNQLGDIQPVGGLNEKIEGFLKSCQMIGRGRDYGVIIPWQNQPNLMLRREVREAVRTGYLKIYPVKHFFEAFEILTGIRFGATDINATSFLKGSALDHIEKKLAQARERAHPRKNKDEGEGE